MINVYEKLNAAKRDLHTAGLKKTGKNKFSDYDYFELADFLPEIVKLEEKYKFCSYVSFGVDLATLFIIDNENPMSVINVTSPMSSAAFKGMHEIQNLGAVQTYLRRYLYMSAFEIVECDSIDKAPEKAEKLPNPAKKEAEPTINDADKPVTPQQYDILLAACYKDLERKNIDNDQVKRLNLIYSKYGYSNARQIKQKDYEQIRREFIDSALPWGDV